jgi:splicing factor 3B subunit 3
MAAEIVCMSLGSVPPGEQRSRFLAVGLADQTVRVISLDPSVSLILHLVDYHHRLAAC